MQGTFHMRGFAITLWPKRISFSCMEWFDINIYLTKNGLSILLQVIIIHALSFIIFRSWVLCFKYDLIEFCSIKLRNVVCFSKVFFLFFKCLCDLDVILLSPTSGPFGDLFVIYAFWILCICFCFPLSLCGDWMLYHRSLLSAVIEMPLFPFWWIFFVVHNKT